MKRLKIILLSLIFILHLTGVKVVGQLASSSATGHVYAEIIPVFSAAEKSQMNFGKFSPGALGGKIVLSPQSTISVQGNVIKGPGTHNAASFYVSGDVDVAYSISLPNSPVVITHEKDTKTMLIGDWVSSPSSGTGSGMLRDGFQEVYIGATLKVGNLYDNPKGIYTGSYIITFDFY